MAIHAACPTQEAIEKPSLEIHRIYENGCGGKVMCIYGDASAHYDAAGNLIIRLNGNATAEIYTSFHIKKIRLGSNDSIVLYACDGGYIVKSMR